MIRSQLLERISALPDEAGQQLAKEVAASLGLSPGGGDAQWEQLTESQRAGIRAAAADLRANPESAISLEDLISQIEARLR